MALNRIYNFNKAALLRYRRVVVTVIHLLQAVVANYLAFIIRFETFFPVSYFDLFLRYLPYLLAIRLALYLRAGLQKEIWRYSSIGSLLRLAGAVTAGTAVFILVVRYAFGDVSYPRSVYVIDWLLLMMLSGGTRLAFRVLRDVSRSASGDKRVLIVGAGDSGEMIVRDMLKNPRFRYTPVGFIDDNLNKKGMTIHGFPIFGGRDVIADTISKESPDEILIAIPSAGRNVLRELYEVCKPFQIPIKTIPAIADILEGEVTVSQIKPLSLEDLLQREPVRTDISSVKDYIAGRTVLVTGAGGSIGAELCRQIYEYAPSALIMLDRYENGLFDIDLELHSRERAMKAAGASVPELRSVVADLRDASSLDHIFSLCRPNVVFHAAAHKHVPLMELNPLEAIKNNIFGTRLLLETADRFAVRRFVMISTDKAVNPANIMGATKRTAEFLTLLMGRTSKMKCTVVRFGNVLGSNGSVVHIFQEQIRQGGPLTVTHPHIQRFFMLIPEAVQLVLIAGAAEQNGGIYVLDMGEQIRIVDLAENIIRLTGFVPYEEINIEFIGLRPGEKLYEELFDSSESIAPAFHEKLRTAIPGQVPDHDALLIALEELQSAVLQNQPDEAVALLRKIVPTFISTSSI